VFIYSITTLFIIERWKQLVMHIQNYIPTTEKWTNLNVFQFSTSVFRLDGVVLQKLIGLLVILRQIYIFLMHAGYHFLLEVQTRPYMHHQLFPPFNDKKSIQVSPFFSCWNIILRKSLYICLHKN
jgi:hypothetical protein